MKRFLAALCLAILAIGGGYGAYGLFAAADSRHQAEVRANFERLMPRDDTMLRAEVDDIDRIGPLAWQNARRSFDAREQ